MYALQFHKYFYFFFDEVQSVDYYIDKQRVVKKCRVRISVILF